MTFTSEENREFAGIGNSSQPQLFNRTNNFRFSSRDDGILQTRIATMDLLGTRVAHVRSSGHEIDLTELDNVSILMPRVGHLDVTTNDKSFCCRPGEALVFGPNRRKTRANRNGDSLFEANVVLLPSKMISETADRTACQATSLLLQSGLHVPVTDELFSPLLKFCDFMSTALSSDLDTTSSPAFRKHSGLLLGELFGELVSSLSERIGDQKATSAGARHVLRAEQYMRANLTRTITIAEVADAAGISQRSLQLAFQELRTTSPNKTLAQMRLNAIHEALKTDESDDGVMNIALDFGVANIGRFARSYQEIYGEKPSVTRRRARMNTARNR